MKNPFANKSKLDEMQMQKLLTVNYRGFWGVWVAQLVQPAPRNVAPAAYPALVQVLQQGARLATRAGLYSPFQRRVSPSRREKSLDLLYRVHGLRSSKSFA